MRIWLPAILLLDAATVQAHGGQILLQKPSPVAEPMGLALDADHLFITDMATRTLNKVRLEDMKIVGKQETPGFMPTGVALHDGVFFVADRRLDRIERRLWDSPNLPPIPYFERWAMGMAHDGTHLWVVDARKGKLQKLDPIDGTTIESFDTPGKRPTGIAFDGRYLWVADHKTDELYQVNRKDGSVLSILPAPGPYPSAIAYERDALWVADWSKQQLFKVALPDQTPYVEDQPRHVRVTYRVVYHAVGVGEITALEAYVALPREIPGQHLTSALEFSPKPARFETDKWGQQVAVFAIPSLPAGQELEIGWTGDFALYRTRFHLIPERIQPGLPKDASAYLADDKKYDLESPVIKDLVQKLTRTERNPYWRARAIYQHLTDVITYDRSGGWNNAATVLKRGTGSCSEYTFVLVALLRRAGIPARYVGAISERSGDASFDDVFHRWAEAYFAGYGWVPIDANAGYGERPGERGHFFGGRSNRHVVTTIGGGSSKYLDWTYNHHETYRAPSSVRLEAQPISRYRPIAPKDVEPAKVEVLIPEVTKAASNPSRAATPKERNDPWTAVIAVLVALFVGVVIGRRA